MHDLRITGLEKIKIRWTLFGGNTAPIAWRIIYSYVQYCISFKGTKASIEQTRNNIEALLKRFPFIDFHYNKGSNARYNNMS